MDMCKDGLCKSTSVKLTQNAEEHHLFQGNISLSYPENVISSERIKLEVTYHCIQVSAKFIGCLLSMSPDGVRLQKCITVCVKESKRSLKQEIWYNPGGNVSPKMWTLLEQNLPDETRHSLSCSDQGHVTFTDVGYNLNIKHFCHFFHPETSVIMSPIRWFYTLFQPSGDVYKMLHLSVYVAKLEGELLTALCIHCSERPQPKVIIIFDAATKLFPSLQVKHDSH